MNNHILRNALVTFASFIFVITIVSAWTTPGAIPPNGNVSAPLTISAVSQSKTGGLDVGWLSAVGSIKVGTTNAVCSIDIAGALRYNSTLKCVEYCNETAWKCTSQETTSCTLPWGVVIANSGTATAYSQTSVPFGQNCASVSEVRTCTNGNLSGGFTNQNCTVAAATPPTTPLNLTAVAASSSQINLSWSPSTDNVGVTGYKIYRAGTQIATTGNTTYSNTGLTAATLYTYKVSAYDAEGSESAQSNQAQATTLAKCSVGYYADGATCKFLYYHGGSLCGGSGECFNCYRARPDKYGQLAGFVPNCWSVTGILGTQMGCGALTDLNSCYNLFGPY